MSQKQEKGPGFSSDEGKDETKGGQKQSKKTDVDKLLAKADEALGKNRIVHGANEVVMDMSGHSIAAIQESLADDLNVRDAEIEAYVDGKIVNDKSKKLEKGQRLEFMKEAGQKG